MELEEIKTFLEHYSNLKKTLTNSMLEVDTLSFKKLFERYGAVDEKIANILISTAPSYNIFDILRIKRYETKVHTPYLKHLLNPIASHQQGRLFFDSFMENVLGVKYIKHEVTKIQVFEEFSFSDGRIDILILYKQLNIKKGLVIENKIDHHDEEKQLERYYYFLTSEYSFDKNNYDLVYLKPHKSPPTTRSISSDLYQQLKDENAITEIGYHEDIVPWLENLIDNIKAPIVLHTLMQYLKTIKNI